jgi:hypothetical protein
VVVPVTHIRVEDQSNVGCTDRGGEFRDTAEQRHRLARVDTPIRRLHGPALDPQNSGQLLEEIERLQHRPDSRGFEAGAADGKEK